MCSGCGSLTQDCTSIWSWSWTPRLKVIRLQHVTCADGELVTARQVLEAAIAQTQQLQSSGCTNFDNWSVACTGTCTPHTLLLWKSETAFNGKKASCSCFERCAMTQVTKAKERCSRAPGQCTPCASTGGRENTSLAANQ